MIDELKEFLRRVSMVEFFVAFLLASATSSFLVATVNGLVLYPLQLSHESSSWSGLEIAIHGHAFTFLYPVTSAIAVALACLIAVWVIRRADIRVFRDCPHCLESIPAGASVCSFCTRNVA